MMGTFYILYELNEKEEKRRIYTFDNPEDVYDLWQWLAMRDSAHLKFVVEEVESKT